MHILAVVACVKAAPVEVSDSPHLRWRRAFEYGEEMGRAHGSDLAPAARAAETVGPDLRVVYWSGLAHQVSWNVEDPTAQVEDIQEHVPEEAWPALYTGMLITWTVRERGEPDTVLPFAESFAASMGVKPYDGVRIGLQRSRGGDLPDALEVVQRYPRAYHEPLLEELGWRAGDDDLLQRVPELLSHMGGSEQGSFVAGACRGGWKPDAGWEAFNELLPRLDDANQDACVGSLGFALGQQAPGALEAGLEGLDEEWRPRVLAAATSFEAGGGTWERADLSGFDGGAERKLEAPTVQGPQDHATPQGPERPPGPAPRPR